MALGGLVGHRRRAIVCAATAVVVAFGVTSAGSAQAATQADNKSTYIVQMTGAPIASYTGDIPGLAATKPAKGTKIDTRSTAAVAYRDHLKAERNSVLGSAGLAARPTVYNYDVTLNGVAMKLTEAEANRLEHTKGVLHVWK